MASYSERKNKQGKVISYQIRVFRGRDKLTGKQLTPYTMTYVPPENQDKKDLEFELHRIMTEFEAACRRSEASADADEEKEHRTHTATPRKGDLITFSEYVESFLYEKSVCLSPVTIHNYRLELAKAAKHFKNIPLADMDFLLLKKYFTEMQAEGRNQYTGKPLKFQSVLQHYTVLHSFFENAVENEVIERNPMEKLKKPKPRKDEELKPVEAYNEEEVRYMIQCLEEEPLKWRALVLFAIDSGCRAGEVVGLKWSEIDFETGKVNICRNVQYTVEQGVYVSTPKSHRSREIFLNQPVLAVLAAWKKEQDRLFCETETQQNGFCFTTDTGNLMRPGAFYSWLSRFGKRHQLSGIHPHLLRHTMATVSIANGADVVSVSRKLGHTNTAITLNIYSHPNEAAQRRANEKLASAIYI